MFDAAMRAAAGAYSCSKCPHCPRLPKQKADQLLGGGCGMM